MAYYLQMNGTSDRIVTPTITFTEVIFDLVVESQTTGSFYIDARTGKANGYITKDPGPGGTDTYTSAAWSGVYVNGVAKTNITKWFAYDTRVTLRTVLISVGIDNVNIFSSNANNSWMKGKLYSVKFYNGDNSVPANLVAHYDMNTQTVQDQSGNGNHATLTGGTWVSDATGTTQEGASSVTGVSTITASATVIPAAITGSASLQGVATVSATADVVNDPMLGSASLQGIGTATATASVIRSGSASITGVSTVTASAAGLAVLGSASLTGVGWVMCSAIEGQFIVSVVNLNGVKSFIIALQGSKGQTVQVLGLKDNIVLLEGEI